MRQVVGWCDATRLRYAETSSEWEEKALEVFYETWDGEDGGKPDPQSWFWSGSWGDLMMRLRLLVGGDKA